MSSGCLLSHQHVHTAGNSSVQVESVALSFPIPPLSTVGRRISFSSQPPSIVLKSYKICFASHSMLVGNLPEKLVHGGLLLTHQLPLAKFYLHRLSSFGGCPPRKVLLPPRSVSSTQDWSCSVCLFYLPPTLLFPPAFPHELGRTTRVE